MSVKINPLHFQHHDNSFIIEEWSHDNLKVENGSILMWYNNQWIPMNMSEVTPSYDQD